MKIINIKVTDKLKVTGIVNGDNTSNSNIPVKIASGNYKSIILNFEFDNTIWDDNLEKYATFSVENQEGIQVKLEKIDKYQNACYVPFSVLKQNCKINVGAYGTFSNDDNVEKIISTENLYFLVVDGSFSQYLVDETPVDIEKIKLLKDEIISEIDNYSKEKQGNYDANAKTKLSAYNKNCEEKLKNYNDNTIAKIEEYNSNADQKIDEYNENADDLIKLTTSTSNELYRLKTDVLETGESSGNNIHLEDSAWSEMQEISVDGVCEQKTTTGKNLLDYVSNLKTSADGLTNVINADGSITTIGKPTMNYRTIINEINITDILEDGQTYTISQNFASDNLYVQVNATKKTGEISYFSCALGKGKYSFKVDKSVYENYSLKIQTGTVLAWGDSPLTITNKYMLCKGTDTADTSFEPYTGGQPSPSPDYPQEIKSLTGDIRLTSCGKNLFDSSFRKANGTLTVAHGTCAEVNGIFTLKATSADIYLFDLLDPSYFYSEECGPLIEIPKNNSGKLFFKNTNSLFTKNYITQYDENKKSLGVSYIASNVGYATIKSNAKYCSVRTGYARSAANEEYKFSIMLSTNDIPYEPYQGSSLNITIPENEFVGKLDDTYKDTSNIVYKPDGHYHLILNKKVGKVVLDGETNYVTSIDLRNGNHTVSNYVNSNIKILESEYKIIANKLIGTTISKTWNGNILYSIAQSINGHYIQLCLPSTFTTLEQINNWLKDNPTIVYYFLETAYEVDLGIVDQLLTYDEITNIFTDSDFYPVINVKYYRNFITTIQNLQVNNKELKQELVDINNRLTALETAQANVINDISTEESEVTE